MTPISAGDLGDDLAHYLVLDKEDVGHLAIEAIGPNLGAGLGVDELRRDAEAVVGAPDTALEYVARPQLAPEFGGVHGLALVLKGGVAREYAQVARRSRQRGHQVLSQTVTEILLVRVAAQVERRGGPRSPGLRACRGPDAQPRLRVPAPKGRG